MNGCDLRSGTRCESSRTSTRLYRRVEGIPGRRPRGVSGRLEMSVALLHGSGCAPCTYTNQPPDVQPLPNLCANQLSVLGLIDGRARVQRQKRSANQNTLLTPTKFFLLGARVCIFCFPPCSSSGVEFFTPRRTVFCLFDAFAYILPRAPINARLIYDDDNYRATCETRVLWLRR